MSVLTIAEQRLHTIKVFSFSHCPGNEYIEDVVLVSAGTELTLFLVAGTVLGFGFSVRMMLITR